MCGENGREYGTVCDLMHEECEGQKQIKIHNYGDCGWWMVVRVGLSDGVKVER